MKNVTTALVTFLLLLATALHAQWSQTSGPDGGQAFAFAFDNNVIYLATIGGVFSSVDGGLTWQPVGLIGQSTLTIAVQGSTFYASGTLDTILYRSDDHATTWNNIHPAGAGRARNILVDGTTLYAAMLGGTGTGGLYTSSDKGGTWRNISTEQLPGSVRDIVRSGNYLIAATTTNGIFRSSDNGVTWGQVTQGLPDPWPTELYVWDVVASGANVYLGTDARGFYVSTDNGASWTDRSYTAVDPDVSIFSMATDGSVIVAGMGVNGNDLYQGIYRSTDKGQHWDHVISNGYPGGEQVYVVGFDAGTFYAATDRGIYQSTDAGISWHGTNAGLLNSEVNAMRQFDGALFASTRNGTYRTTDAGTTWTKTGLSGDSVFYDFVSFKNDLYAGGYGLYRYSASTNGWEFVSALPFGAYIFTLMSTATDIYAATGDRLYRSTDQGGTWTQTSQSLWQDTSSIIALYAHGETLYAASQSYYGANSTLFRSTDNGAQWDSLPAGIGYGPSIVGIVENDAGLFIGVSNGKVLHSTDGGTTWSSAMNGLPSHGDLNSLAAKGNMLLAAYSDAGLYASTDNGASWKSISNGLLNTNIFSFEIDGAYLFAGTDGNGVWRIALTQLTVEDDHVLSSSSMLSQNYPNPCAANTTIPINLPEPSPITIIIRDELGRSVHMLRDERRPAGTSLMSFDGSALPAGAYIYELHAGKYQERKRMLVVR